MRDSGPISDVKVERDGNGSGRSRDAELLDVRFRALVGADAWATLPEPVQRRFSKRIAPGDVVLYRGSVLETRLNWAGRMLAVLARVVGSPLPKRDGAGGAAVVSVVEDETHLGQIWTRTYCDGGQFPQVIHSEKRFAGPTGLEEHIGYGIGMRLKVSVEERALVFRSAGYFFTPLPGIRITVPRILGPGALEVVHREEEAGSFLFELRLVHPRFGLMVSQIARFNDVT